MLEPCKSRLGKATLHMYLPLAKAQKRYEADQNGGIDPETGKPLNHMGRVATDAEKQRLKLAY